MATYLVKRGDSLWSIAKKYNPTYKYGSNSTAAMKRLANINHIPGPKYRIFIGQSLKLDNPKGRIKATTNNAMTPMITAIGEQSNSDGLFFATWAWGKSHTDYYACRWWYNTGNGIWFLGSDNQESFRQSTYTPPANAKQIRFTVRPIADKHKVNNTEVYYWYANWSKTVTITLNVAEVPDKPSAPTITLDKWKIRVQLDNIATGVNQAQEIEFYVTKNNKKYKTGKAKVVARSASYSFNIGPDAKYKVRCRAIRNKLVSDWSDYSSEISVLPGTPKEISTLVALTSTSVKLTWAKITNATKYEVQYTTKRDYFDSNQDEVTSKTVENVTHMEISGLEPGSEYFFRLRASNDQGNSVGWTPIKSIILGKKPSAPTTWSSTTTAIVGEPLTLYWVHNSVDGSKQRKAEIEIDNGETILNFENEYTPDEEEAEKTYTYPIDTSGYSEGASIKWRVRTAGISGEYSEWSVQRTIDIYGSPVLEMHVTDQNGNDIESLRQFPFKVTGSATPTTQKPIGYHVSVLSMEDYQTLDQIGNTVWVSANDEIYSKYFDIDTDLNIFISAENIDLENGKRYKIQCTVIMNSGLSADAESEIIVDWDSDTQYSPTAEFGYNPDTYSMTIRPYCVEYEDVYYGDEELGITGDGETEPDEILVEDEYADAVGTLVEDITLSVYRRDYTGEFIEIATGLDNTKNTYITDPHPALDYGRYRIIAISKKTGAVSFTDVPGEPIGETSIILQWDEEWNNLVSSETNEADETEEPSWTGSRVILPYNIDVSDKNDIDVSLVKYVGRKRPVSYYGTQLGETSTWKTEIPHYDTDTLYALRRLAGWTGDVYVREPSGSGYWANISVSFSQNHCEATIPVTLEITRVEGEM